MKHQRMCAWSGLVFGVLFLLGWCVIAGLFPPPSAMASAEEIAAFYGDNNASIRAGLLIAMASCTFYIPWAAVISAQMRRIENVSPVLAQTQALSGTAGMLIFLIPIMIWLTATFRPERDPQLILLLNDLGWLLFTITFAPFVSQNFAIALAILGDRSAKPVFPRWAAYFNIWTCLSFTPAVLIVYFKQGPFAWTGLIGLWIPLTLFSLWIVVMLVLLLRAIRDEAGTAA
ncbi:MAG: hypothetical protein ACT4PZ_15185 [Panacagrimonas sp.]